MQEQITSDERARLAALREYDILDTVPEEAFDDLVLLAANICEVPIAFIGFVDAKREWLKSKAGLNISEIPRYITFCLRTIVGNDLCVVSDALADEEYATNPLVVGEPHIRFYAAAPLVTPDGYSIGAICVIDHVARELTGEQMEALRILARQVMAQLELRKKENVLRFNHDELERGVAERTAELLGVNLPLKDEIAGRKDVEKERLQLLGQLVTAQEEERQRIARELHDQVGQYLAALMMGIKALRDASLVPAESNDRFSQLQKLTTTFAQEIRHLSLELHPPALDDLGLHTALSNYVEEWSERYGVAVDFHSNGLSNDRLPPAIETAVYRIVQEALTNVIKHAQAKRVSILLEYRNNRVVVLVEDDGTGFDVEAAANKPIAERRLGMIGMRERIELVGGTLDVESAPRVGTTILARIPTLPYEQSRGSS